MYASYVLAMLMTLVFWSDPVAAQLEDVTLSRFSKFPSQYVSAQVLAEVYRQSGLKPSFVSMPPDRATLEDLAGRIDGEVMRVETYAQANPSLVKVTPAYSDLSVNAFATKPISIRSKEDLQNFRVGIVRGVRTSIEITSGLKGVQLANSAESLFAMLKAGRFDVAIEDSVNGLFYAKKMGGDIRPVGTLLHADVYNMLTPGKAHLAPQISRAIIAMKKTGDLEKLKRKFVQELVDSGIEPD